VAIARQLCELTGYADGRLLDTLAAALAETGDFAGAAQSARRGLTLVERALEATDLASSPGRHQELVRLAVELRERLALYDGNRPYREP
jgi:hypothetical protein